MQRRRKKKGAVGKDASGNGSLFDEERVSYSHKERNQFPRYESPAETAAGVAHHARRRSAQQLDEEQQQPDHEETSIVGEEEDAPSFASSVYSSVGSCSSNMSSSSILSDISVSPFTKRLIQNAFKAPTASTKGAVGSRKSSPTTQASSSVESNSDKKKCDKSRSARTTARSLLPPQENPQDSKIDCKAAEATLESSAAVRKAATTVMTETKTSTGENHGDENH